MHLVADVVLLSMFLHPLCLCDPQPRCVDVMSLVAVALLWPKIVSHLPLYL
jgi:hypothetical protein